MVASLGRLEQLQASGDLQRVIEGLVAQCPAVRLREAAQQENLALESDRVWGPVLIFERLWQELGLEELLRRLARGGRWGFDVERCAFAQVLQRVAGQIGERKVAERHPGTAVWIPLYAAIGIQPLE